MIAHPSQSSHYTPGSQGVAAHDWSSTSINTTQGGRYIKDQHNRSLLLHGCSVSGISKFPSDPDGLSHLSHGFFDHEIVSFVGRPFPLAEAPEHLARLRQWGLTFLRMVVPWESLEHAGPRKYDSEYMDYLEALIDMLPAYGMKVYIDPHQDVWSRHTGGSGAPHWTLELAGFDLRNLKATGAAHAHNLHLDLTDPPPKVWPSGYCKLAAATMATLFWAGDTFAPKRKVDAAAIPGFHVQEDDSSLQRVLQGCMIEAFGILADRLAHKDAVLGFEVMNEPHRGYIELLSPIGWDFNTDLAIGYFPSALQSWALGNGHSVAIPHYVPAFPVTSISHYTLMSPADHRRAWREGKRCIWEEHGVWMWQEKAGGRGQPLILKSDYFRRHPQSGQAVDWYKDFYWPFCCKFGRRMAKANPRWSSLVGPIPNEFCPAWPPELRPRSLVYAPHWYDLQALFSKALGTMSANVQGLSRGMFLLNGLYFGRAGLKKNYHLQIANIINAGYRSIGEIPVVIGETGVPFDLNNGQAFRTGDFSWQERQMDAICSALEGNLVSYNLWNYNPINNDEWGDSWNSENFSWFSTTDVTDAALEAARGKDARLNVGGRVLNAIERPYASKVAGIPLSAAFEMETLEYTLRFANPSARRRDERGADPNASTTDPPLAGEQVRARETEIFLPRRRYGQPATAGRLRVQVADGDGEWVYKPHLQTLYFVHNNTDPEYVHFITIRVHRHRTLNGSSLLVMVSAVVLAILAALVAMFR